MPGVISRGIKAPIIREGDDIVAIVADSVERAMDEDGFRLHERDIVAVTRASWRGPTATTPPSAT